MLDKLDKKIITELSKNARASNSHIGKKISKSKEVVNYRIKRLTDEGIIKKFIYTLNFNKIGYNLYTIKLKFKEKNKEAWFEFFKQMPQTRWIAELKGSWDLMVIFWIRKNKDFFNIIEQINQEFGENKQDMLMTIIDTIYYPSLGFISEEKQSLSHEISLTDEEEIKINQIDMRILKELMKNSRISVLSIARKLNITAANAQYHLSKLIRNKVINKFIPEIDYSKIGLTEFKVMINLLNPSLKQSAITKLTYKKGVTYITKSYGKYDLEFGFVAEKVKSLFDFMTELSKEFKLDYEVLYVDEEQFVNIVP